MPPSLLRSGWSNVAAHGVPAARAARGSNGRGAASARRREAAGAACAPAPERESGRGARPARRRAVGREPARHGRRDDPGVRVAVAQAASRGNARHAPAGLPARRRARHGRPAAVRAPRARLRATPSPREGRSCSGRRSLFGAGRRWRSSPKSRSRVCEAGRLEELRLAALEQRVEADLALGRHDDVVAELEALVAEHPHRERLHGLLMLALFRAGRQADALAAYRRARAALGELGLEPAAALRRLERQILTQDPELDLEPQRLTGEAGAGIREAPPEAPVRRKTVTVVFCDLASATLARRVARPGGNAAADGALLRADDRDRRGARRDARRSSSAMRWWRCSGCRSCTRTTRCGRCGPRSRCAMRCPSLGWRRGWG